LFLEDQAEGWVSRLGSEALYLWIRLVGAAVVAHVTALQPKLVAVVSVGQVPEVQAIDELLGYKVVGATNNRVAARLALEK
jgi:hypothetical protein